MNQDEAVTRLVADIQAAADKLDDIVRYATPEIERDLRMAAYTLSDALCRIQVARHGQTATLLDAVDAGHHQ